MCIRDSILGLALISIALFALPRAQGFRSILFLLFLLGAGGGTIVTAANALVSDIDVYKRQAGEWRARLAGAFQDFFRFEFRAGHTVGLGDLSRLDDEPAVLAAVDRAGAGDVIARLTKGLDTQLGPTWPGGVELSFGQWQKLALARGFMRGRPLLLILDEPTAALDAETEHALFEHYAAAAPVSYTHLDVYKRQLYKSMGLKRATFFDKETFGVDRFLPGFGTHYLLSLIHI